MTNITMHPKSRQVINVLQITDTHLFADSDGSLLGLNTEQSLRAVIRAALPGKPSPDLVLATGDLVHDGTPAAYRRVFGHLEGIGLPVYCLAGNHDEAATLQHTLNSPRLHYVPQLLQDNCLSFSTQPWQAARAVTLTVTRWIHWTGNLPQHGTNTPWSACTTSRYR